MKLRLEILERKGEVSQNVFDAGCALFRANVSKILSEFSCVRGCLEVSGLSDRVVIETGVSSCDFKGVDREWRRLWAGSGAGVMACVSE